MSGEMSPYRSDLVPPAIGAELVRLNEENQSLRHSLSRRHLATEIVTAGAFGLAGVAAILTTYSQTDMWSIAWLSLVGGVYGLIKIANRRAAP